MTPGGQAAGPGTAGPEIRWWPDPDALAARMAAARQAGWRVVRLDTEEADGSAGFLEACAAAFSLPAWFGANWDALDECLADYGLAGEAGLLVVWSGWQELAESDARAMRIALDVLRTAVTGWRSRGVPAQVAVAGDGSALPEAGPGP